MHGIRHTKVPTGCMPCTHSHATVTVVLDGPKLSYSNSRRRPVQRYVPRLYKRDNGLKARIYIHTWGPDLKHFSLVPCVRRM